MSIEYCQHCDIYYDIDFENHDVECESAPEFNTESLEVIEIETIEDDKPY